MNVKTISILVSAAVATLVPVSAVHAGQSCVADANDDLIVDVFDMLDVLEAWGPCVTQDIFGCAADVNDDNSIDVFDLLDVLDGWGQSPELFEYPPQSDDDEAEQIALEMLPPFQMFPTPEQVEHVRRDLDLIRAFEPNLEGQTHSAQFGANLLLITYADGASLAEVECLNTYYQAEVLNVLEFINLIVLIFPRSVNPYAIGAQYEHLAAITSSDPDSIIGGQNYYEPSILISPVGSWQWSIDDGFHDCFDGCDCHYFYTFRVDADETVTLLNFNQQGASWCEWPF